MSCVNDFGSYLTLIHTQIRTRVRQLIRKPNHTQIRTPIHTLVVALIHPIVRARTSPCPLNVRAGAGQQNSCD